MHKAVWGLPQAGIVANRLQQKRLAPHGYLECKQTLGLWKLITRPILFTLVVDIFGVKYERQEDVHHLIKCVKSKYELTADWTGNLYCVLWHVPQMRLQTAYTRHIHAGVHPKAGPKIQAHIPSTSTALPYDPMPKQYGSKAQGPLPPDKYPPLSDKNIKHIQQVIRSILYYVCTVTSQSSWC
jgi:hypothetical protein